MHRIELPRGVGQQYFIFREWFLHWDVDATIPLVVMAHSARTKAGGRNVGNFQSNAEDRWVQDAESEIFEDCPHATQVIRTSVVYPALPSTDQDERYEGRQHVKLVRAEYGGGVRVCISSANLCEA